MYSDSNIVHLISILKPLKNVLSTPKDLQIIMNFVGATTN